MSECKHNGETCAACGDILMHTDFQMQQAIAATTAILLKSFYEWLPSTMLEHAAAAFGQYNGGAIARHDAEIRSRSFDSIAAIIRNRRLINCRVIDEALHAHDAEIRKQEGERIANMIESESNALRSEFPEVQGVAWDIVGKWIRVALSDRSEQQVGGDMRRAGSSEIG